VHADGERRLVYGAEHLDLAVMRGKASEDSFVTGTLPIGDMYGIPFSQTEYAESM
jgi:hypothetical protein